MPGIRRIGDSKPDRPDLNDRVLRQVAAENVEAVLLLRIDRGRIYRDERGDGSGLVRVLPVGNVPGAGRAVGLGDDLDDSFGVGFGFGLVVAPRPWATATATASWAPLVAGRTSWKGTAGTPRP